MPYFFILEIFRCSILNFLIIFDIPIALLEFANWKISNSIGRLLLKASNRAVDLFFGYVTLQTGTQRKHCRYCGSNRLGDDTRTRARRYLTHISQ